ncbi:hypothetical protein KKF38_02285 [Patescibacteria group bacterium]|nr:hypothetical protein [Patescibacteria group bacterium]
MGSNKAEKKRLKMQIKLAKAQAKLAESKQPKLEQAEPRILPKVEISPKIEISKEDKASPALRFAEAVRGILYLIGSASLVLAVILQERGVWLTLDNIVQNLLLLRTGQFALIVIALALFIYGLKHIRLVR